MKLCDDVYLIGSGSLGFDWTHPADCNVYAVDTGDGVVLVDSGTGLSADDLLDHLAGHGFRPDQVTHILLTHLHADHSGGAAALRKKTGAKIVVLEAAARVFEAGREEDIELPRARRAGYYPEDYRWQGCKADVELHDRDIMQIGQYQFQALHTPGHSSFDTCFYIPDRTSPMLFSGDTVMYGGKISLLNTADFSLGRLANSIETLSRLSLERLFPGHGQPALNRASQHIGKAHRIFSNMGVPESIV